MPAVWEVNEGLPDEATLILAAIRGFYDGRAEIMCSRIPGYLRNARDLNSFACSAIRLRCLTSPASSGAAVISLSRAPGNRLSKRATDILRIAVKHSDHVT